MMRQGENVNKTQNKMVVGGLTLAVVCSVSVVAVAQDFVDIAPETADLSEPDQIMRAPMDGRGVTFIPPKPEAAREIRTRDDCRRAHGVWKVQMKNFVTSSKTVACYVDDAYEGLAWEIGLGVSPEHAGEKTALGAHWLVNGIANGWAVGFREPGLPVMRLEHYQNGELDGAQLTFHESTSLKSAAHYRHGILDGRYELYMECLPVLLGQFKDGKPAGVWERFAEPGMLMSRTDYDKAADPSLGLPNDAFMTEWFNAEGVKIIDGYSTFAPIDPERLESNFQYLRVGDQQLYSTNGKPWIVVHYDFAGLIDDKKSFDLCDGGQHKKPPYINYDHAELTMYCLDGDQNQTRQIRYYASAPERLWKIIPVNREGTPHGLVQVFHPTGELLANIVMSDGVAQGAVPFYDVSGNLMGQSLLSGGSGLWTEYWYNGKILETGLYKNGRKEGVWKRYFETGSPKTEEHYRDGQLDGIYKRWYSNGVLAVELEYSNGLKNGELRGYYTDGRIVQKYHFKNGFYDKILSNYYHSGGIEFETDYKDRDNIHQTQYSSDGKKIAQGRVLEGFDSRGEQEGTWQYYLKTGKPWMNIEYDYGKIQSPDAAACEELGGEYALDIENRALGCGLCYVNRQSPYQPNRMREGRWQWWNENGEREAVGSYRFGKMHGAWEYHYPNGGVMLRGNYEMGKKSGIWEGYYDNGFHKFSGEYRDGLESGKWRTYDAKTRKVSAEGAFDRGKRTGVWIYFYASGKVRESGRFEDGMETGVWTQYYESGKKRGEGVYETGAREGLWQWWREDGSLWREAHYIHGKEKQSDAKENHP